MRVRTQPAFLLLLPAILLLAALLAFPPQSATAQQSGAAGAGETTAEDLAKRFIAHVESLKSLSGTYSQISSDGQRASGIFDLEFPSKMHFAEMQPTRNRLISDGTWIASIEEETGIANRYPISATPFAALLTSGLGDSESFEIVGAHSQRDGDALRHFLSVSVKDEEALGNVTLLFREPPLQLEGWIIRDAQGQATLVRLSVERVDEPIDPIRFLIHVFETGP